MESSRLDHLLAMLQDDPDDSFLRYAAALEYVARRQFTPALEFLEGLQKHDPDYLPTYYQLGTLYDELDRPEEATTTLRLGMEIARKQNDLHTLSELQGALDEIVDSR